MKEEKGEKCAPGHVYAQNSNSRRWLSDDMERRMPLKRGSPGKPFLDTADSTNKDEGRTQAEELNNQNSIAKVQKTKLSLELQPIK